MSFDPPARLTGQLLASKGGAIPAGWAATDPVTDLVAKPVANLTVVASRDDAKSGGQQTKTPTASTKARVTLRLDPERHLKLKLAAAHSRMSIQAMVTAAVDTYLDRSAPNLCNGSCACLSGPTSPTGK